MVATPPTRTSSRRQGLGIGNGNLNVPERRGSPQSIESFHPAPDPQTYRDLLIFEERLKQNAARLVKRKKKYQTFLVLLCGVISFFGYNVFLHPQEWQPLHYLNMTILWVTVTMLFLFFASGMYAERITAANKFVPQANRSLRNFNMYLNTRKAPRRSLFSLFISHRSPSSAAPVSRSAAPIRAAENPSIGQVRQAMAQQNVAARRIHIPAIPPTSNPRGELIFSPKVTSPFREGYERYRAAFERRRKEKLEERKWKSWRRWWGLQSPPQQDPSGAAEKGGPVRPNVATVVPVKGVSRVSKNRTRSGTNTSINSVAGSEASSRASSRASSPSGSPVMEKRSATFGARRSRKEDETLAEEDETMIFLRGRDRTPSVGLASEQSEAAAKSESLLEETQDVIAPDPSSVANSADDRRAPEATLREPASSPEAETQVEDSFVEASVL